MDKANRAANKSGGSVTETDDGVEAMQGSHVVYATSWASEHHYGNKSAEEEFKLKLRDWCIDESWFKNAANESRFMHCMPVRRGVTVTDRILDGPRSIVIHEARNRMLVQMAVLHQMLSGS
jgi:ornithine carbamoyltransferase